jgi:hypothetical protein
MASRIYTIAELDRMRAALFKKYPAGSYVPSDRAREIELVLQTHIINGTDPAAIEAAQAAGTLL